MVIDQVKAPALKILEHVTFNFFHVGGIVAGYLGKQGFVLGLTDVDALTLSMTRSVATGMAIEMACRAILMGIIANSIMKAIIAFAIGTRRFGWQAGVALVAMAAAGAGALLL